MIIVITGIYSGIGKYLVTRLRENKNAYIIGLDVTPEEDLPEEVRSSTDEYHRVDLSDMQETRAFLELLIREKPVVDVAIHNAGIKAFGKVTDLDSQLIVDTIQVNTVASILFAKELLSAYEKVTYIIMGSNSGFQVYPMTVVYGASKAAVNALVEGLRQETGPQQRVHAVCPSIIATEEYIDKYDGDPGRFKQPEDVMKAVDRIIRRKEKRTIVPVMTTRIKITYTIKGLLKLFSWFAHRN